MYSTFAVNGNGCLACSNQVMKHIGRLQGVFGADIDYANNIVAVSHTDEVSREDILTVLNELGFYEVDTTCELSAGSDGYNKE